MASGACFIIDANQNRGLELKTIFEFADQDCRLFRGCAESAELAQSLPEAFAVLLGDCGDDEARLRLFRLIKDRAPEVPILLIADRATERAGEASGDRAQGVPPPPDIAGGVLGTIELPIKQPQLMHALHQAEIYRESRRPQGERRPLELFRSLVGNSRAIMKVRKLIERVADSDANVLILGESGTGKEVVARHLHYHSSRRNRPFVPVNCGAIPSELLESELFGHEKGAFTGAISARQGRFELAEGGTLFLDEIGDMSLHMQVKLLRVLQERTFERVGSNKSLVANVRIIAATHRNLEEAIKDGVFREDLFYRLNVFPIDLPALRDHSEDVPLLIHELVARIEHEKRGSLRLSPAAVVCLTQYYWPGNVRELANLIERMAILYPNSVVDVGELPEKFRVGGVTPVSVDASASEDVSRTESIHVMPKLPAAGMDLKEHLNRVEYSLIRQALEESDGVVAQAAKRLGLGRTTLVEKLRKYDISARDIGDKIPS